MLRTLEANPEAYPLVHRLVWRALLRGFPCCVFHTLDESIEWTGVSYLDG